MEVAGHASGGCRFRRFADWCSPSTPPHLRKPWLTRRLTRSLTRGLHAYLPESQPVIKRKVQNVEAARRPARKAVTDNQVSVPIKRKPTARKRRKSRLSLKFAQTFVPFRSCSPSPSPSLRQEQDQEQEQEQDQEYERNPRWGRGRRRTGCSPVFLLREGASTSSSSSGATKPTSSGHQVLPSPFFREEFDRKEFPRRKIVKDAFPNSMIAANPVRRWRLEDASRGSSPSPSLDSDRRDPSPQSTASTSQRKSTEAKNQGIVGLQAAFDAMLWDYLLNLKPVCEINESASIPTCSHEQLRTSSPTTYPAHVISPTPSPATYPQRVKSRTSSLAPTQAQPQTSSPVMCSTHMRPQTQSPIRKQQTSSGCLVALEPVVRTKPSSSSTIRRPRDRRTPLSPRTILEATKSQALQPPFDTTVELDAKTLPEAEQKRITLPGPASPVGRPPTPPITTGIDIVRALTFRSIAIDPNDDSDPSEEIVCQDLTSPMTIKQVEAVLSHVPNEGRVVITELRELPTRPVSKLDTLQGTALFELRRELRRALRREGLGLGLGRQDRVGAPLRLFSEAPSNSKRQDMTSERGPVLDEADGSDRPDTVQYGEKAAELSHAHVPSQKEVPLDVNNSLRQEADKLPLMPAPPSRHDGDSNGRAQRSANHTPSKMKRNIEFCDKYSNSNLMTSLSRTGKILLTCCLTPPIFTFGALLLFQISCECA